MTVFENGLEMVTKFKETIASIQTENDQEITVIQNANILCDILIVSLNILQDNYELIQKQPRPDVAYQSHAANILGCKSILKDQAAFIDATFNNFKFNIPIKIVELVPYYERASRMLRRLVRSQLNANLPLSHRFFRLLRSITFLDAILGRKQNIHDINIEPKHAREAFKYQLRHGLQPQSAESNTYARAVFTGDAIEKRLGKWVPSIENLNTKDDVKLNLANQEQEINFHIVFGRLFISFISNETLFQKNIVEGLRLSRLVLATQEQGELIQPYKKSQQEYTASFQALNEYLKNYVKLINEKNIDENVQQINFLLFMDENKQLKQVFDTIVAFPHLLENAKLTEILDDLFEKIKSHFEDNVRIRQALKLINMTYRQNKGNDYGIEIQPVEIAVEEDKIKQLQQLDTVAIQLALIEKIRQFKNRAFELRHQQGNNVDSDQIKQQIMVDLDQQLNESESYYKGQLLINDREQLPKQYTVSQLRTNVPNTRQKVKLSLQYDGKTIKTKELDLSQCVQVIGQNDGVRLGIDLSTDISPPVSHYTVHKKALPKVYITVSFGIYSAGFALPLRIGQASSAYDVTTDNIEYTLGYYTNVKGGGYNPDMPSKQLQYQYDPNMNFQLKSINQASQQQNKQNKENENARATRSTKTYKGGNFLNYKQIIQQHYEIDKLSSQNKQYDQQDYINLVEKSTGKQMHIIDERKQYKPLSHISKKVLRYAFEEVWKGPNNDPLFFNQYLAAMRQLYQNLIRLQSSKQAERLEILWTSRQWKNPFLPTPILWRGRECYPVRLQMTSKGQEVYNDYKKQFKEDNFDISEDDDAVTKDPSMNITDAGTNWEYQGQAENMEIDRIPIKQGLTQQPYTAVLLQIDTLSRIHEDDERRQLDYFIGARLTGSNTEPQNTYDQLKKSEHNVVRFESVMRFEAPLPEVIDQTSGKRLGYDNTDESLAQNPYALRIVIYQKDSYENSIIQIGQCTIPLRSVFLNGEIKGDVSVSERYSLRIMVSFSPPRQPISQKPQIYYTNIDATQYAKELPSNINLVISKIQQLLTRNEIVNHSERECIQYLTQKQKYNYLIRYAVRTPYYKRGIALFAYNMQNELLFLNDFIMQSTTADQLCSYLQINSIADCVRFSVSVPFVTDTISRYYTEMQFQQLIQETRLSFDQVLSLSGGDYFEHACLLQACLQAKNLQAYVARVSTQTLVNEYFVLVIKQDEEISLINPINGTAYLVFKKPDPNNENNKQVSLQTNVTKIIQLFNNSEILINLQPEMSPGFTSFDFADSRMWACLKHKSSHMDVDFKQYFYTDTQIIVGQERINQLENDRRLEIIEVVKDYIQNHEERRGMLTNFNDLISEQLQQNNYRALDRFDVAHIQINCAYEDSAALLERVKDTMIEMNANPITQFVVMCDLKAFGLKFGCVRLDLMTVKPRHGGGEQKNNFNVGNMFGLGQQ